jgi:hypothetical protein
MNAAFQMNFTHRATHEQAALMSLKNLCAEKSIGYSQLERAIYLNVTK